MNDNQVLYVTSDEVPEGTTTNVLCNGEIMFIIINPADRQFIADQLYRNGKSFRSLVEITVVNANHLFTIKQATFEKVE